MAESEADPQQQALDAIRALTADYLSRLPAKLDEIEMGWQALAGSAWDNEAARDLHRTVHGVTGSGRVFGLPEVSDAARLLEAELQELLDLKQPPAPTAAGAIAESLSRLRAAASRSG